jgi:Phosphoinositide phospholipase C, Ca2+-dependent
MDLLASPLAKAVLPPTAFLPQSWEYQHQPLSSQLDAGIRAFEFDIHPDPIGGLYSSPAMLKFAGVDAKLPDSALLKPGYKVLHVPDIDFSTTCLTLVDCLTAVKQWSDAHPTHVPITILLQLSYGQTDLVTLLGPAGTTLVETQLAASTAAGPTK